MAIWKGWFILPPSTTTRPPSVTLSTTTWGACKPCAFFYQEGCSNKVPFLCANPGRELSYLFQNHPTLKGGSWTDPAISIKVSLESFSMRIAAHLEGALLVGFFLGVQTYLCHLYYVLGCIYRSSTWGKNRSLLADFYFDFFWWSFVGKFQVPPSFTNKSSIYSKNWAPTSYTNRVTTPCYRCLESQWTMYFRPFAKGP